MSVRDRMSAATERLLGATGETALGGSRFAGNLIGALALLAGSAALVAWMLASYLKVDVAAVLSAQAADLWCSLPKDGMGEHCWGDFGAIRVLSPFDAPTSAERIYPLSSRILRLPFIAIDSVAGYQPALIAFLLVAVAALLAPVVWSVRGRPLSTAFVVIAVAGLTTAPFLMTMDRGNELALAVPALLAILVGLSRDRPWMVAVGILVASSVKPQFAVAAVALLAIRAWGPALLAVLGSGFVVVAPYLFYGPQWWAELMSWITTARIWSTTLPLSADAPTNISFAKGLYVAAHAAPWKNVFADVPDAAYATVALGIAGVCVVALLIFGRRVPPLAMGIALLAVAALTSPLAFAYYFAIFLPALAVLYRDGIEAWDRSGFLGRFVPIVLGVAIVAALTPLIVPSPFRPLIPPVSVVPALATGATLTFVVALAAWAIVRTLHGSPRRDDAVRRESE